MEDILWIKTAWHNPHKDHLIAFSLGDANSMLARSKLWLNSIQSGMFPNYLFAAFSEKSLEFKLLYRLICYPWSDLYWWRSNTVLLMAKFNTSGRTPEGDPSLKICSSFQQLAMKSKQRLLKYLSSNFREKIRTVTNIWWGVGGIAKLLTLQIWPRGTWLSPS